MSDWPAINTPTKYPGGLISSISDLVLPNLGGGVPASTAWPSANLAIGVPIRVAEPVTVYKLAIGAGATAAGNFDVGLYDSYGNRLTSSGATAKGSSVEHIIDVAGVTIGPGVYYLFLAADGTNNYIMLTPPGTSPVPLQKTRLSGVVAVASSYTLPSTLTFAASTLAPIPIIGAYVRSH